MGNGPALQLLVEEHPLGIPAAPLIQTAPPTAQPATHIPQVLRYMGWFGEPVPDSPLEAWRVRKVQLLVYLEDGSMQVTEPPETNSGLVQGTLVRRHKLPREGGGVLGFADLMVGASTKVYGR